MTYFKSLFLNFLTVFFVNHMLAGIEIDYYSKIPEIKGDLIFAFGLGFLNSLVYPLLRLFSPKPTHLKIGILSGLISFGAYSIVNLLPLGIRVTTPGAFIWGGGIVWAVSSLINHLELRYYNMVKKMKEELREKNNREENK